MGTPKVSVVVPCYNVEKYLHQCIDSIVNQTLKDLEIILVNDGSTDSTLSILKEYEAKDDRVKIIDKPNGGYGETMNRGFDMATGEYIGIIESDDYAELDMFEKLYNCAKENDCDVVKSGFFYYFSTPKVINTPNPVATKATSTNTFCPSTFFESNMERVEFFNIKPTIWSAIYRKDFIRENKIRFNETPGASFQDSSFNFKVFACAKRVRMMNECFLHYRQDNESSSINSPGKVYCVCDEYDEMQKFLDENPTKKAVLEPIMVRIKFDTYMWNYERLSEPLQAEFIKRFKDDFLKHSLNGSLKRNYFETYKWNQLSQILTDCDMYHEYRVREKNGETVDFSDILKVKRTIRGKEVTNPLVNYALGFVECMHDHGIVYTIKHSIKKVLKRK